MRSAIGGVAPLARVSGWAATQRGGAARLGFTAGDKVHQGSRPVACVQRKRCAALRVHVPAGGHVPKFAACNG